jgi:predicted nucleotidyltransferase
MSGAISRNPPTLEELRARRDEILEIAARRGAQNLRVFGSIARGDADGRSDVDFLVDMDRGRSLFDMGGLLMDLSELLECEVDVVTEKGLRERIRARVLAEAQPL